jgi:HEAT repeat protein
VGWLNRKLLARKLRHPDPTARLEAIHELAADRSRGAVAILFSQGARDADLTTRNLIAECLAARPDPGITLRVLCETFMELAGRRELTNDHHELAAAVFARVCRELGAEYADIALRSRGSALRRAAAQGLGEAPGEGVAERLLEAVRDDDDSVRENAAISLGKVGDERHLRPLVELVRHDPVKRVRRAAIRGLGELGNHRAMATLVRALGDEEKDVQDQAVRALGDLSQPETVAEIMAAVISRHDRFTERVADAIWGSICERVERNHESYPIESLAPLLNDPDERTRVGAARALARHASPAALHLLAPIFQDPNPGVRLAVVEALRKAGDRATTGWLATALDDPDGAVCRSAIEACVEQRESRGLPQIVSTLRHSSNDLNRAAAAWAVCRFGAIALEPLSAGFASATPAQRTRATRDLLQTSHAVRNPAVFPQVVDTVSTARVSGEGWEFETGLIIRREATGENIVEALDKDGKETATGVGKLSFEQKSVLVEGTVTCQVCEHPTPFYCIVSRGGKGDLGRVRCRECGFYVSMGYSAHPRDRKSVYLFATLATVRIGARTVHPMQINVTRVDRPDAR